MARGRWCLILKLSFAAMLLSGLQAAVTVAAPLPQISSLLEEEGEEYVVRPGDWLSKISLAFYGDVDSWQLIVEATNEKATSDERFAVIEDPDALEVGQLLWIPNLPDAAMSGEAATGAEVTDGEAMTATLPEGGAPMSDKEDLPTVRFASPHTDSEVPPRFEVEMAAAGLVVEAAGEIHEGAGHFHILLDTDFVPPGELLLFDENHLHFGRGQLTTTLELEPGVHVLRLQFANGAHIALAGDQYRDTITVTVRAGAVAAPVVTPRIPPTSAATGAMTSTLEGNVPAVRFASPQNGSEVVSTFAVEMAAEGLEIEPAGEIAEGSGHFHILLDTDFIPPDELLPFDENHLHFGQGQLTTTLELEPGVHVLRLQFANGAHIALAGDQYRDTITVTVVAGE